MWSRGLDKQLILVSLHLKIPPTSLTNESDGKLAFSHSVKISCTDCNQSLQQIVTTLIVASIKHIPIEYEAFNSSQCSLPNAEEKLAKHEFPSMHTDLIHSSRFNPVNLPNSLEGSATYEDSGKLSVVVTQTILRLRTPRRPWWYTRSRIPHAISRGKCEALEFSLLPSRPPSVLQRSNEYAVQYKVCSRQICYPRHCLVKPHMSKQNWEIWCKHAN